MTSCLDDGTGSAKSTTSTFRRDSDLTRHQQYSKVPARAMTSTSPRRPWQLAVPVTLSDEILVQPGNDAHAFVEQPSGERDKMTDHQDPDRLGFVGLQRPSHWNGTTDLQYQLMEQRCPRQASSPIRSPAPAQPDDGRVPSGTSSFVRARQVAPRTTLQGRGQGGGAGFPGPGLLFHELAAQLGPPNTRNSSGVDLNLAISPLLP